VSRGTKRIMRVPIRIKLASVYLIVISAMIMMAYYALRVNKKIYIDEIGYSSLLLAEEMFKRMDQRVFHLVGQFQIQAKSGSFQEVLSLSNDEFDRLPDAEGYIRKKDENWTSTKKATVTPFMEALIDNALARHIREVFIDHFGQQYGFALIHEIIITNKYGANIAISAKTSGYNQGDEEWWQQARNKGIFIGRAAYDESTSSYGIDMAIRIDDMEGKFAGILLAGLGVKDIIREAEVGTRKYNTTQVQIVTDDGKLIYSTMPHRFLDDVKSKPFFRNFKKKDGYFTINGAQPRLFSFTHSRGFKYFKGFGWILIISHQLDEVLKPYLSLQKQIITIYCFLILFCIALILFLGKMITSPLKSLTDGIRSLSEGRLDQRVAVRSNDEFSDLTSAFNIMLEKRQQAERELKESEERFRAMFEQAAVGVALIETKTGKFFKINQKFCDIVGYTAEEMTQLTFMKITHADDLQANIKNVERLIAGEVHEFSVEKRYCHKDGFIVWGNLTVSPMWNIGEKPSYHIAIVEDITDRKHAEENLHFTKFAVDRSLDTAFWIKPDGSFSYVNDAACQRLGFSRQELLTMSVPDIDPNFPTEKWPLHWQDIKEQGTLIFETCHQAKDGKTFPVEVAVSYTEFEGKEYHCAFVRDLSERKKDEEEKKKLEDHLQRAYKMEAIGTLAGGIAHDFNNILTPIIVQSELALMDIEEKSPIRFNLQEVMKAGLRAKDLVKQILTFSRQSEQQPVPLKITPIIKEAIKLLRASLPTTIEIRLNFQNDEGTVNADPTQIHQVLMNLCTNAGHAMRDKGGVLDVSLDMVELDSEYTSTYVDLEPGPYLKLSVSDTGHGISPELLDRIFDPFFTTKDRSEGTGMGLAVVHGIIKNYGGEITVESELGKGATFMVFFPSVKALVADEPEVEEELPMGNERVLVVDDEKGMIDAMGKMLNRLGYQVVEQTTSMEALIIFEAEPDRFDLVITDQTMPNITGLELAKIIMQIRSDIPIILCTGFSERVNEESAIAMGISAFVLKPIVMRDIAHTIRQVLDKK